MEARQLSSNAPALSVGMMMLTLGCVASAIVSAVNVRAGQGAGKLGKFPEFRLFAAELIGRMPGKINPRDRKPMYRFQGNLNGVQRTSMALGLAMVGLVTDGKWTVAVAPADTRSTMRLVVHVSDNGSACDKGAGRHVVSWPRWPTNWR